MSDEVLFVLEFDSLTARSEIFARMTLCMPVLFRMFSGESIVSTATPFQSCYGCASYSKGKPG